MTIFLIHDETHAEWWGEFPSYESALEELKRRAGIPWDAEPNRCPCSGWRTCDRKYQVIEWDDSKNLEVSKEAVLEISSRGIVWLEQKSSH